MIESVYWMEFYYDTPWCNALRY